MVAKHYFVKLRVRTQSLLKLFDIDISGIFHRKVYLFINSVSINSVYSHKFKLPLLFPFLINIVNHSLSLADFYGFATMWTLATLMTKLRILVVKMPALG